jgi:thiol-disulfide isomerase/thioredoxin
VTLENCGKAPEFANVTAWLQTPNEKPLSLVGLRGHVVLVDFWTYTCINCQRTLPHVEAWYQRYHPAGLEVIGVHTPEFSFEHDVGNVQQAAGALGVKYPIAVDNAYGTWDAYSNEYWPAEYLIDATGHVRHVSFGEGNYQVTERQIRELLIDARPGISLPTSSNLPDTQPVTQTNPETYLGTTRLQYLDPSQTPSLTPTIYQMPRTISVPNFGLGGTWSFTNEAALAGSHASLNLPFTASDVYLVMGGEGTVRVSGPMGTSTIHVHGIPTLYTLARAPQPMSGVLSLTFTPGIKAYDFTFG